MNYLSITVSQAVQASENNLIWLIVYRRCHWSNECRVCVVEGVDMAHGLDFLPLLAGLTSALLDSAGLSLLCKSATADYEA